MKIKRIIYKFLSSIGMMFILIHNKISNATGDTECLYGPPTPSPLYGIPKAEIPTGLIVLFNILRICIIPVSLAIGLVVYFKKCRLDKKRKIPYAIILSIIIIAIGGGIIWLITYYINDVLPYIL